MTEAYLIVSSFILFLSFYEDHILSSVISFIIIFFYIELVFLQIINPIVVLTLYKNELYKRSFSHILCRRTCSIILESTFLKLSLRAFFPDITMTKKRLIFFWKKKKKWVLPISDSPYYASNEQHGR